MSSEFRHFLLTDKALVKDMSSSISPYNYHASLLKSFIKISKINIFMERQGVYYYAIFNK